MRLLHYSAGLALYALLLASCQSAATACDPAATGSAACQATPCTGTLRDCKNGAADGCETDTAVDVENCGGCGIKCAQPANGEAACSAGVCGVSACGTRYKDCNAKATDGCEIDTFRDANNCGACGTVCTGAANAAGVCIQGKCQLACQAAYLDCNSDPSDGCETNGASDLSNCGNCGNTCAAVGATNAACSAGSCISTACSGSYQTCQSGPIDSCEINTASDPKNCGACGKPCAALANAASSCTASNCGIASCNPGFGNCDGLLPNGCEINTTSDPLHCGMCNNPCLASPNALPGCTASKCTATCLPSFADCDKLLATGCEVNTTADKNNCGACGTVCDPGLFCIRSKCTVPSRVLLAHSSPYISDVQTKLLATGMFTAVDLYAVNGGTPTLTELQAYDVVMVFSDSGGFNDANAMGNVLADYFDAGGRVVMAVFGNASIPVRGRWESGNYQLINPVGQESPTDNGALQLTVPTSSLLVGVKTLIATAAYRSTGLEINGGVVIARWGSGAPLVVAGTKGGKNLVSLNFYPPSVDIRGDFWSGDGVALMQNALVY